jgi:type II secretion system protein J
MNIEHPTLNSPCQVKRRPASCDVFVHWLLAVGCSMFFAFPPSRRSSPRPGAHRARRGFTLVEVLIATLSFAVIMAALNTTFYAAMRLRSRATKNADNLIPMNQAGAIIKRDLAAMIPSTNEIIGPMLGEPRGMMMSASSYLEFYTTSGSPTDDMPWGDVQKVAYYLKQPEVAAEIPGFDLIRAVSRNILPVNTEEIDEQPIMTGVESLDFEYYDGSVWQPSWDASTMDPSMPKAIRVIIELSGQNYRVNDPLQYVVPLTVQGISTNETQTASSSGSTTTGGGGTSGGGTSGGGTSGGGSSGGSSSGGSRSGGSSSGGSSGGSSGRPSRGG